MYAVLQGLQANSFDPPLTRKPPSLTVIASWTGFVALLLALAASGAAGFQTSPFGIVL